MSQDFDSNCFFFQQCSFCFVTLVHNFIKWNISDHEQKHFSFIQEMEWGRGLVLGGKWSIRDIVRQKANLLLLLLLVLLFFFKITFRLVVKKLIHGWIYLTNFKNMAALDFGEKFRLMMVYMIRWFAKS